MQKGCQIVQKKNCNLSIFSVLKKNCRFRHNFDLFFAVGNIYFYLCDKKIVQTKAVTSSNLITTNNIVLQL